MSIILERRLIAVGSFVVVPCGPSHLSGVASALRSRRGTGHRDHVQDRTCSGHMCEFSPGALSEARGGGGAGWGQWQHARAATDAHTLARSRMQPCTFSVHSCRDPPHASASYRYIICSSNPLGSRYASQSLYCVYVHGTAAPRVGRPRRPSCVKGLRAELSHPCASFRSACLVHSPPREWCQVAGAVPFAAACNIA